MILQISIPHELLIALAFTVAFGLMFFISELIYIKFRLNAEITRKFIHLSCGSIALLVPMVRPHPYTIIILGLFFSLLTFYMFRKGLLPSVHGVKRHSIGSILFPLGVVLCTIFGLMDDYRIYFFLPLSTMIFSDTVAALAGMNYPLKQFLVMGFTKSIGGSTGFFISAFLICFFIFRYFNPWIGTMNLLGNSLVFGLATAFTEMISVDGWDDVNVPVAAFIMLWILGV